MKNLLITISLFLTPLFIEAQTFKASVSTSSNSSNYKNTYTSSAIDAKINSLTTALSAQKLLLDAQSTKIKSLEEKLASSETRMKALEDKVAEILKYAINPDTILYDISNVTRRVDSLAIVDKIANTAFTNQINTVQGDIGVLKISEISMRAWADRVKLINFK